MATPFSLSYLFLVHASLACHLFSFWGNHNLTLFYFRDVLRERSPRHVHLYQRPYPDTFDLVPYPTGWRIPDFIKFSGDDNRSTWEHINQYVAQLGEASSSNALRVRLFSLSLTGTAFSWFSSLSPNLVCTWNELEQKFHDHFYSGENEAKLIDLTLVRQGRDESVSDYFTRFKEIKN